MTDVKRLVYSFIQFLGDQLQSGSLTPDAAESLEVAIQCLESAYGIDHANPATATSLRVSRPLLTIFSAATQNEPVAAPRPPPSPPPATDPDRMEQSDSVSSGSEEADVVDIEEDEDDDEEDDDDAGGDADAVYDEYRVRAPFPTILRGQQDHHHLLHHQQQPPHHQHQLLNLQRPPAKSNGTAVVPPPRSALNGRDTPQQQQQLPIDCAHRPLDLSLVKSGVGGGGGGGGPPGTNGGGCEAEEGDGKPEPSQQNHQLVRMPPKGGCVQCGKERRVTKRGRPHESYFGCRNCQVHLCRKRNCFQVFHSVELELGQWNVAN